MAGRDISLINRLSKKNVKDTVMSEVMMRFSIKISRAVSPKNTKPRRPIIE